MLHRTIERLTRELGTPAPGLSGLAWEITASDGAVFRASIPQGEGLDPETLVWLESSDPNRCLAECRFVQTVTDLERLVAEIRRLIGPDAPAA